MLAEIVLTNEQAVFIFSFAFVGMWKVIGIPPVKDWFKEESQEKHGL